jgi:hypothetical protein
MRASGGSTHVACSPHFSSTRAVSARMEGGTRACGVAADRWWYCRGGGEQRAAEHSVRGVVAAGVCRRGKKSFTVTHNRSITKELQMHASAQPLPRVRRIDFINQLSAPFTADSAPAGKVSFIVDIDSQVTFHAKRIPQLPSYSTVAS